jgi:hypothetical protein
MTDELRPSPIGRLLAPAFWLTGLVVAVALALFPLAIGREGSGGFTGLLIAAGVCLAAGWSGEGISVLLHGRVQPVGIMVVGMAIRVVPPLAIVTYLAASGQNGRQHLAFIGYLVLFYLSTLSLETYLAVKRLGDAQSKVNPAR